jgi:hypothetical protein
MCKSPPLAGIFSITERKISMSRTLPRGRQLVTLRDAALYIGKLPKAEQQLEEWQRRSVAAG